MVAEVELIPAPVGTAIAVIDAEPRVEGFQTQVTVLFVDDPDVNLLIHPGILIFCALKVTRAGTVTTTVMVTARP